MFFFQDFDDFFDLGQAGMLESSDILITSHRLFDHGTKKSSDGQLDLSDWAEILRIDSSHEYCMFPKFRDHSISFELPTTRKPPKFGLIFSRGQEGALLCVHFSKIAPKSAKTLNFTEL